ncbi:flagellar biosynthetic protein FliO [Pseudoduganella sp. LjRoot289]|uniref:flagellar biosynthetic protein FliO n=1 Tax=Pseudoduganella sp. LjRoot289 TaxID=3342314 RepID=UPI003ECC9A30
MAPSQALAAQTASGSISGAAKPAPAAVPAPAPVAVPAQPDPAAIPAAAAAAANAAATATGAAPGAAAASPAGASTPASATLPALPAAPAAAAAPVATPEQQAALAGARPSAPVDTLQAPSATGSILTTIFSLILVLGVLVGLAWALKRYGPKSVTGGANIKLVGALSVGARERILVVEVGEQWIVVGASPGRMNALATMPRQEGEPGLDTPQNGLPSANFAEWFKQTIEKRNGK